MGTADTYTLSNIQRLFLQNHLPLFSTGAIADISRPTILRYVDILRSTISSDEHAADVATGELVRLRLDEITTTQQKKSTIVSQSSQTKPRHLTGGTYQSISIWRWQPDKRLWRYLLWSWFCFVLFSFTLPEKVSENAKSTVIHSSRSLTRSLKLPQMWLWFTFLKSFFLIYFWSDPWELNYVGKHLQLNICSADQTAIANDLI